MKVDQLYTKCLAQGAYYIESNGEAAIIDPLRETQPYLDLLQKNSTQLKYIFETHFHADFVSGHVDLAQKTGATIVFGPNADTDYTIHSAKDTEVFEVGEFKIKVLHTPGHTLESTTYLLIDPEGKHQAIFTGDTLFIGDVGRPDLAIKSNLTEKDLAGMLYDSLRNKIMPLGDDIIVYPAHGAGSACGKNMSSQTFDTLGNQKKTNYALRTDMTKEEFATEVLDGLGQAPAYFAKNALMNKLGYPSLDVVMKNALVGLTPEALETKTKLHDAILLDTRKPALFKDGFIRGSISIGIDGGFAPWVGNVLKDIKQAIILICDEGRAEEVVTRLSRVGYDNIIGYLEGGFPAWVASGKAIAKISTIEANEIISEIDQRTVLDVRKPGEYGAAHLEGALSFPLGQINANLSQLNKDEPYFVHCKSGYRSMIAASVLQANGFNNLVEVRGGFLALQKTNLSVVTSQCSSK
jgi:glyoxylase-like metal-dependent hydrolase (beta-lactamase superfamily II)/rhodanese-related sulfurtransferase